MPTYGHNRHCYTVAFQIKILGVLSIGDGQKRPISFLLSSQHHYLKSYITLGFFGQEGQNRLVIQWND